MVKPPLRTKTVGTKLSEPEYAQLEAAARERGLTLSEWCRTVLLASGNGHATKSAEPTGSGSAGADGRAGGVADDPAERALSSIANGERLTAEEMQRLIERADADKLKKAQERLEQAAGSGVKG